MTSTSASLILTVLNEAKNIRAFLDSVAQQTLVPAEIVIVDGGSSDGTVLAIESWQPPRGCAVTVLVDPGAGISRGRNLAITRAQHEFILVTDAGTAMNSDWTERMLAPLCGGAADVVSGFFHPVGTSFMERLIAFAVTPMLSEIDPARFLPSSRSVAFTQTAWRASGGYPEWLDYCEDLVFDIALLKAGHRFEFEPRAQVSWSARSSIRAFMKQYYRYARGDGKAGLWLKRHVVRYAAYITGVGLLTAAAWRPWLLIPLAVGSVAYMSKTWRRILKRRREFGSGATIAAILAPMIVVSGDLSKMVGYPVGLAWRRRNKRTWTASVERPLKEPS